MATFKIRFHLSRQCNEADGMAAEGQLYIQIIHNRMVRRVSTPFRLMAAEWDSVRSCVRIPSGNPPRARQLMDIQAELNHDLRRLALINARMAEVSASLTADHIAESFRRYKRDGTLAAFMTDVIDSMRRQGRIRTAENYVATLNSFTRFLRTCGHAPEGVPMMMDRIDSRILAEYQSYLSSRGLVPNTISFYMRILRAVYNRAAEEGLAKRCAPFRHVYTGIAKTVKRALPLNTLRRLRNLDLSAEPNLEYARDMFLLSFYLRGMSFIDMAFLRNTDLNGSELTYRRHKTGQTLTIRWTPEMQTIISRYPPATPSPYLLPILSGRNANVRAMYRNKGYNINRSLKTIGTRLGSPVKLTLYVARHSWASVARAKNIPISVISEGMGHDSEATTRIYLASLEAPAIDRANDLIIKSIR